MAHNITSIDSVAFAGTGAWHHLGITVPENMGVQEAVTEYLGWAVNQQPIYYKDDTGAFHAIDSHVANVRSDHGNVLGVVGNNYSPIQHADMVEDIKALCGESGAKVHTIGSVNGGKRVWILLETTDTVMINGDRCATYIAVVSSHDGSMAYTVAPTTVRIVCDNTLSAAIRGFGKSKEGKAIRIKHTVNAQSAIQQARKAVGAVKTSFDEFAALANHLAGIRVNDRFAGFIAEKLFKGDTTNAENEREKLIEAFKNPRGGLTRAVDNTAFGVFNAATEYVDYLARCRKTGGKTEDEARAESALMGAGATKRADALAIIQAVVEDQKAMDLIMADSGQGTPLLDTLLA